MQPKRQVRIRTQAAPRAALLNALLPITVLVLGVLILVINSGGAG